MGQVFHPILVAGTAWALPPHLSPFFFVLKTCLPSRHPWAWRDWELLELILPGHFPLYEDIPPSVTPAQVQWEPGSAARGSQQVLLALHTMAAALSSPQGTAQLTTAPLCLQLSTTKGYGGGQAEPAKGVNQPLLPYESASLTPPAEEKGREKEDECYRKPLPFQEAGLTQEIETTNSSVVTDNTATDKWHALPTIRHRQGAKSLSPGKLFPQPPNKGLFPKPAHSVTQQGEPLAWTGSAAGQLEEPTSAGASLLQ